jgi:hypothetical protein
LFVLFFSNFSLFYKSHIPKVKVKHCALTKSLATRDSYKVWFCLAMGSDGAARAVPQAGQLSLQAETETSNTVLSFADGS